jgi:hypothetical protein
MPQSTSWNGLQGIGDVFDGSELLWRKLSELLDEAEEYVPAH